MAPLLLTGPLDEDWRIIAEKKSNASDDGAHSDRKGEPVITTPPV
jgi:hypothetical protein